MAIVGIKDDEGKPRTDLLPPKALIEVSRVLGYGAAKYTDNGYREVSDATRRYTSSALYRLLLFMSGEQKHEKSGLQNLAHVVSELLFVLEMGGKADDFNTFKKRED